MTTDPFDRLTGPRPATRRATRAPQSLSGKAPAFTCPVCSEEVQASITVALEVGEPTLKADNPPVANPMNPGSGRSIDLAIGTKLTRYNVRHDCNGPVQADEPEDTTPDAHAAQAAIQQAGRP